MVFKFTHTHTQQYGQKCANIACKHLVLATESALSCARAHQYTNTEYTIMRTLHPKMKIDRLSKREKKKKKKDKFKHPTNKK